ncbi:Dna2-domain-containing protein [Flagelloscypha sp. PMI_526]|nr:Dna2-domain-containing protein [Flagelloscypha sp. PMI_526]
MVWGNMLHEVMQNCLRDQIWTESHLNNQIESVVRQGLTDLVTLGVTSIDAAVKEVKDRAVGLMSFAEKYLSDSPKDSAVLEDTRAEYGCTSVLAITSLHDVEEDIWSPTFGLKGKLDATMETKISTIRNVPLPQHRAATVTSHQDGIRPFEIKTGRPNLSSEHRAQTMLYTLLLSERYNTPVESGLLYYTQSEEVILVPRGRHEIRGLITGRNAVAGYMVRRHKFLEATAREDGGGFEAEEPEFLPRPIDDERMCKRCYVGDSCMLYRKAVESLAPPNDPILADLFDRRTSHLTDSHTTFFKKWERLISYEELDMVRFRKELWTMKAEEREKRGRCFSSMVLDRSTNPTKPADATKIHQHTHFVPKDGQDGSLLSGHLNIGDAIVISVEPNLLALSRVHFRLDKDELQSGLAKVRHNLAQVFYSHGHTKSLSLLVDLEAPPAIAHVLSAEDYSLILGMPGTGKTTIIATLIRCLIKLGKTVLLTSYTHSAVDNVLLKFAEEEQEFGILRIGNTDKIHPQIRKFSLSARRKAESVEQLEIQLMSPPLVATTCLSIDQFVRNPTARKGGLDVSLFRRLSEAHPNAVVDLVYQYRMNEDIMTLSNTLIYDNRLKCGSEEVARRSLNVPQKDTFLKLLHKEGQKGTCKGGPTQCWIEHVLSPDCNTIFLDTDSLPALDSRVGDLVQNEIEADLVYQLTEALLASGVAEFDIGLISLYRQQIKILAHRLQARPDVEILTADRSQGRDKECVIISLVRSNAEGLLGDLVKDWRRMNVSFTRARSKLVIFGSRKTLQGEPLLKDFFKLMSSRGWILALPPKAHLGKRSSEEPEERVDPQTPKRRKMKTKMLSEEGDC